MSFLDDEAEELKKMAPKSGTGRKVSQAGFGALKSLSKYSSLTAKYRTNNTAIESNGIEKDPLTQRSPNLETSQTSSIRSTEAVNETSKATVTVAKVQTEDKKETRTDKSKKSPSIFDQLENDARNISDFNKYDAAVAVKIEREPQASVIQTSLVEPKALLDTFESNIKVNTAPFVKSEIKSVLASGNKMETNGDHTGIALVSTEEFTGSKPVASILETGIVPESKPVSQRKVDTCSKEQTIHKIPSLLEVDGLQRKAILVIYGALKISRSLFTHPISRANMAMFCSTTVGGIKITLQRLVAKNAVIRGESKDGRGGWTRYGLNQDLYNEIVRLEDSGKLQLVKNALGEIESKLVSESVSTIPSSSSLFLKESNKTNTTETGTSTLMPVEWNEINTSQLADTHLRISRGDIVTIFKMGLLTAEQLQESIDHAAHDILVDKKEVSRAAFFGVVKKNGSQWVSQGYLNGLDKQIKQQLEAAKRMAQIKAERLEESSRQEFKAWLNTLSESDKVATFKDFNLKSFEGPIFEARARQYYEQKVLGLSTVTANEVANLIESSLKSV